MTDTDTAPRKSFAERRRDAAMQMVSEQYDKRRLVLDALNLQRGDHAGDVIHLDDRTAIVEVANKSHGLLYAVVHDGQRTQQFHETLDYALLYAVQLRAGGRPQDGDYVYAARVLRIEG
jgi:hypothetical protein